MIHIGEDLRQLHHKLQLACTFFKTKTFSQNEIVPRNLRQFLARIASSFGSEKWSGLMQKFYVLCNPKWTAESIKNGKKLCLLEDLVSLDNVYGPIAVLSFTSPPTLV